MNGFNLVYHNEQVAWYETEQEAVIGAAELWEVTGLTSVLDMYIISDDGDVTIRDEDLVARIRTCGL